MTPVEENINPGMMLHQQFERGLIEGQWIWGQGRLLAETQLMSQAGPGPRRLFIIFNS